MVLLMSVNPGFGGQSFIEGALDKAKVLKTIIDQMEYDIDIEMDGGLKPENVQLAIDAGVNIVVAGSAVFGSDRLQGHYRLAKRSYANGIGGAATPKGRSEIVAPQ